MTFVPLFYWCLWHTRNPFSASFLFETGEKSRIVVPLFCVRSPPPVSSMVSLVRRAEWRPIMSLCLFQLTQWAVWGCDVSLLSLFLPLILSVCRIKGFLPQNASNFRMEEFHSSFSEVPVAFTWVTHTITHLRMTKGCFFPVLRPNLVLLSFEREMMRRKKSLFKSLRSFLLQVFLITAICIMSFHHLCNNHNKHFSLLCLCHLEVVLCIATNCPHPRFLQCKARFVFH